MHITDDMVEAIELLLKKEHIKSDDIIKRLGINDGKPTYSARRLITRIRDRLWDKGILVLADKEGYYIPQNDEEVQKYLKSYRKRAITTLVKFKHILQVVYRNEEQSHGELINTLQEVMGEDTKDSAERSEGTEI